MSSRALRRALREKELEKQLAAAEDCEDSDEVEPGEIELVTPPKNAFDMLNGSEDVHTQSESDDGVPLPQPSSIKSETPSQPSKQKKKRKKAKKKVPLKEHAPPKHHDEDDIDRAIMEIAAKNQTSEGVDVQPAMSWEAEATKFLAIDQRWLNPTNEMRSLFGNVALENERTSTTPRNQRRREINLQGGVDLATALTGRYSMASRGKELGVLAKRRNCFMQGNEEWPLATSGGLSMEHAAGVGFERSYNITHNSAYNQVSVQFRMAVASMQAESMIGLLVMNPYHIATLLQVSEIAKHQGDHSVSGDLLERSLFSFGRSVHSSFPAALRAGIARLDFNKPSNRELYLTIWRYIRNLEMRGTWRTAYEWSKVLLQFNTMSDPFGVTLMVDQLALRGRQHQQLLQLSSEDAYGVAWGHLPNIQISLTLAYLRDKKPKEARRQLALAIHRYPYILSALASALEIQPLPKSLWGQLPSTDAEKLYSELYVTRARDLWNTPENTQLLSEVAETMDYYKDFVVALGPAPRLEISLEEARHIMLLEIPALIALLPRKFTNMPTSAFDVLPPPDSASEFTARAPTDSSTVAATNPLQALLAAGNAAASTANQGANTILNRVLSWFQAPANAGDTPNNETQQADIEALREEIRQANGGAEVPDDVLNALVSMRLDQGDGTRAIADGWDYYEEAAGAPSEYEDTDGDSAVHMEGGAYVAPVVARNSLAATVEDEQEDEQSNTPHRPITSGRAVLRRAESDDEDDIAPHPPEPTHTLFATPTTQARPSTVTPAVATEDASQATPTAEDPINSQDPQRIQRYLITRGLQQLQNSPDDPSNLAHYIERLKLLRKNQQDWIIGIVAQRAGRQLSDRIKDAL